MWLVSQATILNIHSHLLIPVPPQSDWQLSFPLTDKVQEAMKRSQMNLPIIGFKLSQLEKVRSIIHWLTEIQEALVIMATACMLLTANSEMSHCAMGDFGWHWDEIGEESRSCMPFINHQWINDKNYFGFYRKSLVTDLPVQIQTYPVPTEGQRPRSTREENPSLGIQNTKYTLLIFITCWPRQPETGKGKIW